MSKIKDFIVTEINSLNGIKATELIAHLFSKDSRLMTSSERKLPELLEELVEEKRILEVEYTVPSMPYRVKSFYLPADTELNISGKGKTIEFDPEIKAFRVFAPRASS